MPLTIEKPRDSSSGEIWSGSRSDATKTREPVLWVPHSALSRRPAAPHGHKVAAEAARAPCFQAQIQQKIESILPENSYKRAWVHPWTKVCGQESKKHRLVQVSKGAPLNLGRASRRCGRGSSHLPVTQTPRTAWVWARVDDKIPPYAHSP